MINKSKEIVKKLPVIKPHLDLVAALLSIPVLITVFILNFSTLSKLKSGQVSPTPSVQNQQMVTAVPIKPSHTNPTPTDSPSCKPDIGPISITDPAEGDVVTTNPLCITIDYQSLGYCSVVWAYKVNNGPLSDYSNNSVCLYNMPSGQITFELQVKSLVSTQTRVLKRTFQYNPSPTISPTATPSSSPTPSVSVTPNP